MLRALSSWPDQPWSWVGSGACRRGTESPHSSAPQAWRDLGESPYSLTLITHNPQASWVWQEADRKGPQELAGRTDSERMGGHEGGRNFFFFPPELLDVKLGTRPSKRKLCQTQGPESFYSKSCQTQDWLILQTEPDITTSLAE